MPEKAAQGLVHIYTGNGKGKTTAALGLALRASGQGLKVGFIQFLKNEPTGEHMSASKSGLFEIIQISTISAFSRSMDILREEAQKTLVFCREQAMSGNYDLLVLDEVLVSLHNKFIGLQQIIELIEKKPASLELVLTGRYAPPELIQKADLVTEMLMVKHPYDKGIRGRKGIEY